MARFWRMNGRNVFYPMGFDDNGLPTERLVEKRHGVNARQVGRQAFIEQCLAVSEEAEKDYEALWQRLGLSIDWRYTYRTIDELSRRISQRSFIDLYRKGLAYRQAPAIWCPECRTAIAQAELNDLERESEFVTLPFALPDGGVVAHRHHPPGAAAGLRGGLRPPGRSALSRGWIGQQACVPLFGQERAHPGRPGADPAKRHRRGDVLHLWRRRPMWPGGTRTTCR